MSINLPPPAEARLIEAAQRQGISVDALMERLINEHVAGASGDSREAPELPVWHLGPTGSLHRRDIYDDVR